MVIAKDVFVFILAHATATAEAKAEAEGGICRRDGGGVGCWGRGLVEGF